MSKHIFLARAELCHLNFEPNDLCGAAQLSSAAFGA